MTVLEEIYEAAGKAAPSGADEALLQRLCRAAAARLEGELRSGVTMESCRDAFVCAAVWTALAGLFTQESAQSWNVESFTVGDVSVKTSGGEKTSSAGVPGALLAQAKAVLKPYCRGEGFSFLGVRG